MPDLQDTISRVAGLKFDCPADCTALYMRYQAGAAKRGYAFELSIEQARVMFSAPCMYCHYPPRGEFNGIDRVDNAKGYLPENCVPCCKWCNRAKGDGRLEQFMEWIWYLRPDLRPSAPEPDTPRKRVIRWHNTFGAFRLRDSVPLCTK